MTELGKYLVIEGIDAAGKTTQVKRLAEELRGDGVNVAEIAEPGSTNLGRELRRILLSTSVACQPETHIDLFMAARREIVHQVIKPCVNSGEVVVSDRNWFSTVAMQGFGEGMDHEKIIRQAQEVMGEYFMPDKAVILDLPVSVAMSRLGVSRTKSDRFEAMGHQFFEKVRGGYLWLAEKYGITVVEADQPASSVQEEVYNYMSSAVLSQQVTYHNPPLTTD